ncbi:ADP-ribosylglycohydrolase family protein [Porphyromonas sp.]
MIGAIIGDIVGSRFEFRNYRAKNFDLLTSACDYTDDTICTVAVADALIQGADFGQTIHTWCRRYPDPMGSYGGRFAQWVASDQPRPYGSFGNGSAMRVSPCGWLRTLDEVLQQAEDSARCSHNHPEGIRGAQVVAHCIWALRQGASRIDVQQIVEEVYGYQVAGLSVSYLQRTNRFDETCQGTIPPAICCFLESQDFEDAIRNAVSIGGDSDTIGAIVGGIAEAHYGVPEALRKQALTYLPTAMQTTIQRFDQWLHKKN